MSDNEELIPLLPSISEMHKALLHKDEAIDTLMEQVKELAGCVRLLISSGNRLANEAEINCVPDDHPLQGSWFQATCLAQEQL